MSTPLLVAYFLHQVTLPSAGMAPAELPLPERTGQATLTVYAEEFTALRSVPPNAQRVEMGTLRLTASCTRDVPVASLSMRRRGLGESSDIASVYLIAGGQRISRGQVPQSDGDIQLRPRRFTVPACATRTISVYADFSPTAAIAGQHAFTLEGVDAGEARVVRSARTAVRSPVVTSGVAQGRVQVEYLPLHRRIRYGANRLLSRIRLDAQGSRGQSIAAIQFTNQGTAKQTDLQNLYLATSSGRRLSNVQAALEGKTIWLELKPPLLLSRSQSVNLSLRGDVRAGIGRTVQFIIEEPADIVAEPLRRR